MILTASVGGCLTFLERFREEERQLLAMKEMLIIFEKQLEYVRLPIAEAVTDMAKKAGAPFEAPLMEFTEKILYHQTEEVERLWRECFEAHRRSFFLNREEFAILLDMGRLLEPVDSKSQIASVEMYINRVEEKIQKIWEERENKQKVYQSVYLFGGLLLIIVTVLTQILKHSGREEQAFLTSLAGLLLVLFWIVPYIYELFSTMKDLFAL